MRIRLLLVPALCALVAPFAGTAGAAPACFVLDWRNGDSCTFEAPIGEFAYGGVATEIPDGQQYPWVAVQVVFQGQVVASCYGQGTSTQPARCEGRAHAFTSLTHVCRAFGTGGPIFHCADPPPLPLPLPVGR